MRNISNLPTPPRTDDLTIPLKERKTIASLAACDCRWPFGDPVDPDFHFCGKPTKDGSSYCDFHVRRAFQPARPRTIFYRPNVA
jgi:GcrA cell cycle regulator